jgi:hypothetical protein
MLTPRNISQFQDSFAIFALSVTVFSILITAALLALQFSMRMSTRMMRTPCGRQQFLPLKNLTRNAGTETALSSGNVGEPMTYHDDKSAKRRRSYPLTPDKRSTVPLIVAAINVGGGYLDAFGYRRYADSDDNPDQPNDWLGYARFGRPTPEEQSAKVIALRLRTARLPNPS